MDNGQSLDITLLQTPSIRLNGQPINLNTKKGEALFYYLLIEEKASRDRTATLIWEDEPAEQARRHQRDALYLLRKQLGDVIIASGRYTLMLNPAYHINCDTSALENGDISVYLGEFLQDFHFPDSVEYELWVERCRDRFRTSYLKVLAERIAQAEDSGDTDRLEEYLRRYLREEPLSENMTVQLMRLYRRKNEYSKVAAVYQRLYKQLSDEMGIAPLKETAVLYYDIMEEWNNHAETDHGVHDEKLPNRQSDYGKLSESLISSQSYRAIVVSGAHGVGKTHTINRLLAASSMKSRFVITASCYKSKQNMPLYVWQSVSASLSQFIIDKKLAVPEAYRNALSSSAVSMQLTDQRQCHTDVPLIVALFHVIRTIAKRYPLLLVLENIQWIDTASLNLLDQIMRAVDRSDVLTLATCVPPCPKALSAFLETAQDDRLLFLHTLLPFTREETYLFVDQYSGVSPR